MNVPMKCVSVDLEDGYFIRACKIEVGSWDTMRIEWLHPNWGYYSDAMLWARSVHFPKWRPVDCVMSQFETHCEETNLEGVEKRFRKTFPEFNELFDQTNPAQRFTKTFLDRASFFADQIEKGKMKMDDVV